MRDPIVEEVRAVRSRIAAECGNDFRRFEEKARATAERLGRKAITLDEWRRERAAEAAEACIAASRPAGDPSTSG